MRLVPGLPLILTMLVAGCVEPDLGPDAAELANIRKSNIVPKSSTGICAAKLRARTIFGG